MAKRATKKRTTKKKRTPAEGKKRYRRSPEEMISDLEGEIARLKAKAAAKEAKQAPEGKAFLAAVRALDKAAEAAKAEGNSAMTKALAEARKPMQGLMDEMGVRVRARRRRVSEA